MENSEITARVQTLAEHLLEKIELAIDELNTDYETVEVKEGEKPDQTTVKYRRRRGKGPVDRDGFKAITTAMKDVLELTGADGDNGEIRVIFDREGEDYSL